MIDVFNLFNLALYFVLDSIDFPFDLIIFVVELALLFFILLLFLVFDYGFKKFFV